MGDQKFYSIGKFLFVDFVEQRNIILKIKRDHDYLLDSVFCVCECEGVANSTLEIALTTTHSNSRRGKTLPAFLHKLISRGEEKTLLYCQDKHAFKVTDITEVYFHL